MYKDRKISMTKPIKEVLPPLIKGETDVTLTIFSNPNALRIRTDEDLIAISFEDESGQLTVDPTKTEEVRFSHYNLNDLLEDLFPGKQYDKASYGDIQIPMSKTIRDFLSKQTINDSSLTLTLTRLDFPVELIPGKIEITAGPEKAIWTVFSDGKQIRPKEAFQKLIHPDDNVDLYYVRGELPESYKLRTKVIKVEQERFVLLIGLLKETVPVTLIAVSAGTRENFKQVKRILESDYNMKSIGFL